MHFEASYTSKYGVSSYTEKTWNYWSVRIEKFNKEEIKTEIKKWLTENPTDTLEHCKEYSKKDLKKYMGYEIINFYENNKIGVPSLVFIRGEKEYYKPLN